MIEKELRALNDLCKVTNKDFQVLHLCSKCSEDENFEQSYGNYFVYSSINTTIPVAKLADPKCAHVTVTPMGLKKPVKSCCTDEPTKNSACSGLPVTGKIGLVKDLVELKKPPCIVEFYDAFPDLETSGECFVLEYMHFESLQSVLNLGRLLTQSEIAIVSFSILSALQYMLICGYIHRDIKVFSLV
jgi:serine/threonine protein kinase